VIRRFVVRYTSHYLFGQERYRQFRFFIGCDGDGSPAAIGGQKRDGDDCAEENIRLKPECSRSFLCCSAFRAGSKWDFRSACTRGEDSCTGTDVACCLRHEAKQVKTCSCVRSGRRNSIPSARSCRAFRPSRGTGHRPGSIRRSEWLRCALSTTLKIPNPRALPVHTRAHCVHRPRKGSRVTHLF
jgi:hypothetical protein